MIPDVLVHALGNANAARRRLVFQPGRDVHRVPQHVAAAALQVQDVALVDADADLEAHHPRRKFFFFVFVEGVQPLERGNANILLEAAARRILLSSRRANAARAHPRARAAAARAAGVCAAARAAGAKIDSVHLPLLEHLLDANARLHSIYDGVVGHQEAVPDFFNKFTVVLLQDRLHDSSFCSDGSST